MKRREVKRVIREPDDGRVDVDAVGDHLARDVGPLEDRRQRPGVAMVQRGHGVEQVSDVRDTRVETLHRLVVCRVRMSERGDRFVVHEGLDDVRAAGQLRRHGHHPEAVAEQGINVAQGEKRRLRDARRQDHAPFLEGDERPLQVHAEQVGPAEVAAGALGGHLQMAIVLSRPIDRRGQETRHAEPRTGPGDRRQGLRRGIEHIRAAGPLDMHIDQPGREDAALRIQHLVRLDVLGRTPDTGNLPVADEDARVRGGFRCVIESAIRDKKRIHALPIQSRDQFRPADVDRSHRPATGYAIACDCPLQLPCNACSACEL